MTNPAEVSPREAARAFTPELTALIEAPLYDRVWADPRLSARDRSLATVAACIVLSRPAELRAQLVRAVENGLTRDEISALITHLAFYAGFPAAIDASVTARDSLGVAAGTASDER
jgi:4-carboxymuconolactone decarboxylase